MTVRPLFLLAIVLASCGRSTAPLPRAAATIPAPPPARPVWVARKVVRTAVDRPAGTITVSAGQGWSHLAARSGVPVGALAAANGQKANAPLAPGQTLAVPAGRVHTVAAGESGIAIARAYDVPWNRVIAANGLAPPYTLEIGDKILLPSTQVVAAMSIEERARAFRIDIDDLITGAEPAVTVSSKSVRRSVPTPAAGARPSRELATLSPAPRPTPRDTGPLNFAWPVDGRILSGFGPKSGGRYNDGVNLKASAGSAVRAAADGVVAYAGDAVAGFGNLILVKHADGWVTAYGHNEAMLVARGAKVRRGDVIARAGATGAVDEPQVHFELRHGRTAVDPLKLLPARG